MSTATVDAGSPATKFIVDMFSSSTVNPVYLSSLANKDAPNSEPRERHVTTRSSADIDAFVRRWDRKHRGLYFCVSTIQAGVTRRAKETASELTGLHADIDFKSVTVTQDEIKQKLRELTLLPSKIVDSGNGLHCYWHFREALPATSENIALVETLLRQLAEHLGGDPAVCEIARLMRLPGTHNTKEGAWNEVRVVSEIPARYDPGELAEWLDELNRPAIARKPEASKGNGQDTNPWLQVAARYNFKPPIDVEQRLAAMQFQGADSAAIHPTQLAVSASLLTHGTPLEEVVEMLLAATRAAAGPAGARWNWQREERDIRDMCKTWLTKHPELGQPDAKTQDRATPAIEQAATERATETDTETGAETANEHISEQVGPSTGEQQTNAGAAAAPATGTAGKKTRKRKLGRTTLVLAIADGVIKAVRQAGNDLLLTGGELHVYGEGIWMVANAAWEQRLRVLLQEGAEALGEGGDVKLLSAAWRRLLEHPGLYFERVNWDPVGKIAVANGVLDLRSKEFTSWSPQYFLRRKRLVAYDPVAKAPQVDEFLARLFQDRDAKTAAALIGLLQEFAGAALCVQLLHREQRRALFPVGPSRTGKSELARLYARLIGPPIASPSVGQIGERFGLACFFDATAWIRDDAVNEGDRLDPQRFKTIVTGEAIDIERKNRAAVRVELTIPVVLTANSLPASRDASDAVFNRSLVVDLTQVFDEQAAINVRRRLGVPPGTKWLADFLFDREGPGVLNWALAGLARLLKRGAFDIPEIVDAAIQRFKDESNPVAEFSRTMLEQAADTKVDRADMLCAFHGWFREEAGDDSKLHGARWLVPKLRTACPWAVLRKMKGKRYFCGVKLTDEALKYWLEQASAAQQSGHGSKGASSMAKEVNQDWTQKELDETPDNPPF